jgi:hypothetical protein
MAEAEPQAVDFWSELEEAAEMVEGWEEWRQRYEADVHGHDVVDPALIGA